MGETSKIQRKLAWEAKGKGNESGKKEKEAQDGRIWGWPQLHRKTGFYSFNGTSLRSPYRNSASLNSSLHWWRGLATHWQPLSCLLSFAVKSCHVGSYILAFLHCVTWTLQETSGNPESLRDLVNLGTGSAVAPAKVHTVEAMPKSGHCTGYDDLVL